MKKDPWIVRLLSYLGVGSLIYFSFLLLLITLQYIPISKDVAFLRIKQDEIQNSYYLIAFFVHVYSSIFLIFIGLLQFSVQLRLKSPRVHRLMGKLYVFLLLFVAGPTGFVIALSANGGTIGQLSFVILAVLWIIFTFLGYYYARSGNFKKHNEYMLRSYALTLSAISLRLFKWGIVTVFELPPMDTYQIVSVLGWTVNLAIVEIFLPWKRREQKKLYGN